MVNEQLLNPRSIAVIGASNNIQKTGGKVLYNIIQNHYKGQVFAVNPKETEIQGVKTFASVQELPQCDLAIIAIAAKYCPETVDILAQQKNVVSV